MSDSEETVGAILLVPVKRVAATILSFRLAWLHVMEPYRCRGIGRTLLQAAAAEAAKAGAGALHVPLRPSNATGIALFDSLKPVHGAAYVIDLTHGGF